MFKYIGLVTYGLLIVRECLACREDSAPKILRVGEVIFISKSTENYFG